MSKSNFTEYDFKVGDKNNNVKFLQRSLRESIDTGLKIDGDFGQATLSCLKIWQSKLDFTPNGLYSGDTKNILNQYINKRFIQEWSYAAVANTVGRDQNAFRALAKAIASVESRAEGFIASGAVQLLFERHKFKSLLIKRLTDNVQEISIIEEFYKTKFTGNRVQAAVSKVESSNPNICNSSAGGYLSGMAEQGRFELAMAINPSVATNSASFGLYQIMGFNAKLCGYKAAHEMLKDFMIGEYNHLLALARFLEANEVIYSHLKKGNYEAIAKLYNGPAYAKNNYHVKIGKALQSLGY